jgi:hypothetical protein
LRVPRLSTNHSSHLQCILILIKYSHIMIVDAIVKSCTVCEETSLLFERKRGPQFPCSGMRCARAFVTSIRLVECLHYTVGIIRRSAAVESNLQRRTFHSVCNSTTTCTCPHCDIPVYHKVEQEQTTADLVTFTHRHIHHTTCATPS